MLSACLCYAELFSVFVIKFDAWSYRVAASFVDCRCVCVLFYYFVVTFYEHNYVWFIVYFISCGLYVKYTSKCIDDGTWNLLGGVEFCWDCSLTRKSWLKFSPSLNLRSNITSCWRDSHGQGVILQKWWFQCGSVISLSLSLTVGDGHFIRYNVTRQGVTLQRH